MNLRAHRTVTADATPRWSGIDAGRRVQTGSPVTGIRHFRVGAAGVKRAGGSNPVADRGSNACRFSATVRTLAAAFRPVFPAANRPAYDLFQ
jgi:hypothetical protein